jgi:hypothetical protein
VNPQAISWDALTFCASAGQLTVLVAGAVFAYLQLRGLRRQQEAQVVQHIFDELNAAKFSQALNFVYNDLPERLRDVAYAREIRDGTATVFSHREMIVMHFFNELGILVHERLISELIVPFVASPCIRSWKNLAPVIELMRRRYPHAYTPLEALVTRARAADLSSVRARYLSDTPHLRSHWEVTGRDLIECRIVLFDE